MAKKSNEDKKDKMLTAKSETVHNGFIGYDSDKRGTESWRAMRELKLTEYGTAIADFIEESRDPLYREMASQLSSMNPMIDDSDAVPLIAGDVGKVVFVSKEHADEEDSHYRDFIEGVADNVTRVVKRRPQLVKTADEAPYYELPVDTTRGLNALDWSLRRNGERLNYEGIDKDGSAVVRIVKSNEQYDRRLSDSMRIAKPTEDIAGIIEDSLPSSLLRDYVVHSLVTGDEILLSVGDPNETRHTYYPVSFFTYTLSEPLLELVYEARRYMNVLYTMSLIGGDDEDIDFDDANFLENIRNWDLSHDEDGGDTDDEDDYAEIDDIIDEGGPYNSTLMVFQHILSMESVDEAEISLKAQRMTAGYGLIPPRFVYQLVDVSNVFETCGDEIDPYDLINLNDKVNMLLRTFEAGTNSIVTVSDEASNDRIDPLASMPKEDGIGNDLSEVFDSVNETLRELTGNRLHIEYLGRRILDGKSVFVFCDEDGSYANSVPAVMQ